MNPVTLDFLTDRLRLAEQLRTGRDTMFTPQDLPGRYGRAVKDVDHLLRIMNCASVLAGGWAVWRHGYVGRVTDDIDIVLPADQIEEFLRLAAVSGFEMLPRQPGRWPKVRHKGADIRVDILPEGGRPGTPSRMAPTVIQNPSLMGASGGALLQYINLPSLIELKLAAGRARDESDVVELIRANPDQLEAIREHLATVHADYVQAFDRQVERADEQRDE